MIQIWHRDFFYIYGYDNTSGVSVTSDPTGSQEIETDPRKVATILARKLPHFTERGFEVMTTPASIHDRLSHAYRAGLENTRPEQSDPDYLTAGDPDYIDIGSLAYDMGHALHLLHEEWAGQRLELTAAYGLRIYRRGQVLRWHVDRAETHVISSIVHIDSESDNPWPLHIEDHLGDEHEVCLRPGQMLLYESATCPHARATPFAGEHFGSLFVHFKPIEGWDFTADDIMALLKVESPAKP